MTIAAGYTVPEGLLSQLHIQISTNEAHLLTLYYLNPNVSQFINIIAVTFASYKITKPKHYITIF